VSLGPSLSVTDPCENCGSGRIRRGWSAISEALCESCSPRSTVETVRIFALHVMTTLSKGFPPVVSKQRLLTSISIRRSESLFAVKLRNSFCPFGRFAVWLIKWLEPLSTLRGQGPLVPAPLLLHPSFNKFFPTLSLLRLEQQCLTDNHLH